MKVCSKCKLEKELDRFGFDKFGKNGFSSQCKDCKSEYMKQRYLNGGKEKSLEYQKQNKAQTKRIISKYQSKMQPGVYRLWTEDGDYIGESIKMQRRISNHKEWNYNSPVSKPILGWEILEVVQDETQRKQREIYWIKKLNPSLNNKDYHWGSKYH